ncbi:hypothetical protein K402DRAFT_113041 [Aulographum hederae CBS 113979]|uniref:Uncharacterized protein n=1 Tax=Aulographum hederae CBS 113979 TaxID=1176131 RepID=A0A6G1GWW7_9PEZI|nr:hypothetical protein K402DRAFT_113041 [Aulographum hederae CBS 113979]
MLFGWERHFGFSLCCSMTMCRVSSWHVEFSARSRHSSDISVTSFGPTASFLATPTSLCFLLPILGNDSSQPRPQLLYSGPVSDAGWRMLTETRAYSSLYVLPLLPLRQWRNIRTSFCGSMQAFQDRNPYLGVGIQQEASDMDFGSLALRCAAAACCPQASANKL